MTTRLEMRNDPEAPRTLVLGIGNTLLSDEGVGIHVLKQLSSSNPAEGDVHLLDGGTLSFTLAEPIENCDRVIVIDASELGDRPGTVRVFEDDDMDSFVVAGNKKSPHEVGLADVLAIVALNDRLPKHRALVGIQPKTIDWGDNPTPEVAAAIPVACDQVNALLDRWAQ